MPRRRKQCGDSLGASRVINYAPQTPGLLVENGDRVRVVSSKFGHTGEWGRVDRQLGLGRVDVRLDHGETIRVQLCQLWFLKLHPGAEL